MWFAIRRRISSNGRKSTSERRRASFGSLIKRRKFDQIIHVLKDDTINATAWLDKYGMDRGTKLRNAPFQLFKAQLPLHTALHYQPPVELVDLLIGRLVETAKAGAVGVVSNQNMLGQSPLHIAVIHNADIRVIERLLQDMLPNVLPCDIWGRTPLHWVVAHDSAVDVGCFRSSTTYTSSSNMIRELESKVKIITAILTVYPFSLKIRDNEGYTALELGRRQQSDGALLYLLGQASHNNARKVKELTVCNNTGRSQSFSKAGSRQPQSIDTPDTLLLSHLWSKDVDRDIPVEIVEVTDSSGWWNGDPDDDDDASSVGTGGISKFYYATPPRTRLRQARSRPSLLFYERVHL